MEECILSVGIDVGTTTTQLIFSRLTISTSYGFGMIPRTEVVNKEVVYRSAIHLTPLRSGVEIDGGAVAELIRGEYERAGYRPKDIKTGAVIITGETARKRNASEVASALAELSGDFVVAAAGADMESVLAGYGAKTDRLSEESGCAVINLDIGGGTTNLSLFRDGKVITTGCYDIGGRLIGLEEGRVAYIAPKMETLLKAHDITLSAGDTLSVAAGEKIASAMADILAESVGLAPETPLGRFFVTNHGLQREYLPTRQLSFSGGVADCIFSEKTDLFEYDDLGVLLGQAIRRHPLFSSVKTISAEEAIRATVIGAGNFTMEVSGSTIEMNDCRFPIKNLPVLYTDCRSDGELISVEPQLRRALGWVRESPEEDLAFAVAMDGPECPSFAFVEQLSEILAGFFRDCGKGRTLVPVLVKHDFAKALGQALRRRLGRETPVLCVDGITCHNGDYIDIGESMAGGAVVPVVVKTLIFS